MAKYTQLSYGSTGEEVKELQEALNNTEAKYGLDPDGIYGDKTKAAVLDYQTRNGLAKDGIAGDETLGHLYKANTAATAPAAATPTTTTQAVTTTPTALQTHQEQKPEDFTWEYQEDWIKAWEEWIQREEFSYDLTSDPVYQQYKDQYTHLGQLAMMDTMGQAATLTGGYGNSYAQSAGQQAYQGYLQQLSSVMPELYGQAYERYQAEGEAMYNEALAYEAMRQQAYAEYQDETSRWYQDRDYLASLQAQDREYMKLLLSMGYEPSDQELTQAGMTRDQATALTDYYDSVRNGTADTYAVSNYSTTDTYTPGYRNYDNGDLTKSEVAQLQEHLNTNYNAGLTVDGKYGTNTANAVKNVLIGDYGADEAYTLLLETPVGQDTENTKLFMNSVMTKHEFAKHGNRATVNGKSYDDYKNYIEACLEDWTENGIPGGQQLSAGEVLFLMGKLKL